MTKVPKVELHCHLEGAAGPALIRQLAERNNITLADTLFTADDRFAWADPPDFCRPMMMPARPFAQPRITGM